MSKKSKYLEELLELENKHQLMMNQIVTNAIHEQEELVKKIYEEESHSTIGIGDKISDKISQFGGSWSFVIYFFSFLLVWMLFNIKDGKDAFDPFPFILLNLMLSCLAAIQAPIILMSQNRKEFRDRKRSQDDYLINLKSELESRLIDQKLDLFINEQFKSLIDIQKTQIDKLEEIESLINKLSKLN
jgi:uncharacterized membrane protein